MLPFLSDNGILGLNARNLLYVKPYNPRKAVAFADDKLKTKAFLSARGIPTAKLYARIETREQLRDFDFNQLPNECVLKPNEGFGGEGILILKGRKNGMFLKSGKEPIPDHLLREHIEDTLDGMYSLGGRRDVAFFEQILVPHESFARFRPAGLPDIRIIVFNLVPVMAMLRIPTAESDGKANVHLGGIGIGIDMAKGVTTYATQYNRLISELPHGGSVAGIKIPYWEEMLLISSRIQQLTNIGYLAVDITIDQNMGPALLEVNARAGLMVQIANLAPLRSRLERVKGIKVTAPEKGVRIGQDLFGRGKGASADPREPSDKPILGTHEVITISGDGTTVDVPCQIAPQLERTLIDRSLVAGLLEKGALELTDEGEQTYRVKFTLAGKKLQTVAALADIPGDDQAMIGRRDLSGFLIDPSKEVNVQDRRAAVRDDLRAVDSALAQLDKDLLLLRHLKPLNLEEERERAEQDRRYNPVFVYGEPAVDLDEAERKLRKPIESDSPLGVLLEKKRQELLTRIALLRARGDAASFTRISRSLFGAPSSVLIAAAQTELQQRAACELPVREKDLLSAEQVRDIFADVLQKYSLHEWQATVRPRLVADCTVGGHHIYIRESARFSRTHVDALIAHEIETHILTAENGDQQNFVLFRRGTAHYLDTQEGLAVYAQNRIYGPYHEARFNPPRNVLAIQYGLEHSFAQTRAYLEKELGFRPEKALSLAIFLKRGLSDTAQHGAFTKGLVYFRGLRAIEHFVENGGDLRRLFIGKIAIEDLEQIEKITELIPPVLLPAFLRTTK